jgi:hypothetical protein
MARRAIITGLAFAGSAVSLVISSISLYFTALQRPMPAAYVSGYVRSWLDEGGGEVIAVPLTIANHGARDTVIRKLLLTAGKVSGSQQGSFSSAGYGDTPREGIPLFVPVSIKGHDAYAGSIIFKPVAGNSAQIFDAKASYRFCIWLDAEKFEDFGLLDSLFPAPPDAIAFEAELPWFDYSGLKAGKPHQLHILDGVRRQKQC